jgi:hypothetical protein
MANSVTKTSAVNLTAFMLQLTQAQVPRQAASSSQPSEQKFLKATGVRQNAWYDYESHSHWQPQKLFLKSWHLPIGGLASCQAISPSQPGGQGGAGGQEGGGPGGQQACHWG